MPQPKRGLGKGLGALIPSGPPPSVAMPGAGLAGRDLPGDYPYAAPEPDWPAAIEGAYLEEVPVGAITPNPRQPRQVFDQDTLAELAASIGTVGLLQPVVVRKLGSGRYELIMGERRWRASQLAGAEVIPAIVRDTSDDDMLRDALIENLHREQLNPLEEAAAYQQLLDDFAATHEELARRVGRSRPHISNTIRLLNLPPAVQKRVAAGVLSAQATRAPCWASRIRSLRNSWRTGSWPRGYRSGQWRNSSPSVSARPRRRVRPAAGPGSARTEGSRGPALGRVRHQGEGRAGAAQGQDRGRVRRAGGSGADRPHDVSRSQSRPPDLGRRGCRSGHGPGCGPQLDAPLGSASC